MSDTTAAYTKASGELTVLSNKLHAAFQAHEAAKRALSEIQTAYSDAKNLLAKLSDDMEREVSKVDEPAAPPVVPPKV